MAEANAQPASAADGDASPEQPTILLLASDCRPGFEANGPTQSLAHIVAALSHRYRFRVLSRCSPLEEAGQWRPFLDMDRLAIKAGRWSPGRLFRALKANRHDLLVLNSFFDPRFTIYPLLLRRLGLLGSNVLIAPRGEFSPSALSLKPVRKSIYLRLAKLSGLFRNVHFQGTTDDEVMRIRQQLGLNEAVLLGPNVRTSPPLPEFVPRPAGSPLRVAFVGRIAPMKNLVFALECLAAAAIPIEFRIFGIMFDRDYWSGCQRLIEALPAQVKASYDGIIEPARLPDVLARHDLFLLPTLGENYGHAIIDSLLAGTPVLISDRTPWRDLQKSGAGWSLGLDDRAGFLNAIREAAAAQLPRQVERRAAARAYGERAIDTAGQIRLLTQCYDRALAGRSAEARDGLCAA
jgi:glycosyltransferase involved in cell wall biosynthesis